MALGGPALSPVAAAASLPPDTMPLSAVRAGMVCRGLTVVRGSTIADFRADVVDVASDPGGNTGIIVRVSGGAAEPAGIAEGFSGSPILCPGDDGRERFVGALAATAGDRASRLGFVTPIEQLLAVTPLAPLAPIAADSGGGTALGASNATTEARSTRGRRTGGGAGAPLPAGFRPLRAPLVVSGVSPRLAARLAAAGRRAGVAVAAPGAGGPSGFTPTADDLRPGAAVAASLVSGDVGAAAIGTITYRRGTSVWAFGHPLGDLTSEAADPTTASALGRRSLFLQGAYVYGVVDAPTGLASAPYKLAAPAGGVLGAFTNDRTAGVAGVLGAVPRAIAVEAGARDLDSGRAVTLRTTVADETPLDIEGGATFGALLTLSAALDRAVGAEPARTTDLLCISYTARQLPVPIGGCGTFFDGSALDAAALATTLVERFDRQPFDLTSIRLRLRRRTGAPEAYIERASAPRRVRRGRSVTVALRVAMRRGGSRTLRFKLRVPRKLKPGVYSIRLRAVPGEPSTGRGGAGGSNGGDDPLAMLLAGGDQSSDELPKPRSLPELALAVRSLLPVNGVAARFGKRGAYALVWRNDTLRLIGSASLRLRVLR
mgnify:FL=1